MNRSAFLASYALRLVLGIGVVWGMELVPGRAAATGGAAGADETMPAESGPAAGRDTSEAPRAPIRLDRAQQRAIGVTFGTVERRPVEKTIHTVGRFDYDERKLAEVTLKIGGYVGELFVDSTGRQVVRGEPLLSIYSPDLVSAQQEYLLALETRERLKDSRVTGVLESAASMVRASRERLRLWDLSDRQIAELARTRSPSINVTLHAPISGVVIEKAVTRGQAIQPGMMLYRIADLSTIWVYADLYEYELPLVRVGQEAEITVASYPDQVLTARVAYIYPAIDPKTRTAKLRFEVANSPELPLFPQMYGNVSLRVPLGDRLVVPETAILDSGRRQVAFVEGGDGRLMPRQVRLGQRVDDSVEVTDGLSAGERVVTSANFLIDSESKLQAAESMMSMMGAIGMGDWKMESAKPMQMSGGESGSGNQHSHAASDAGAGPSGTGAPEAIPERKVGDLLVAVFPASGAARVGEIPVRVRIRDQKSNPVTGATVRFNYTMDMPGMTIEQSEARELGGGVYEGMARFTMGGPWGVVVEISRPGKAPLREKFTIRVAA